MNGREIFIVECTGARVSKTRGISCALCASHVYSQLCLFSLFLFLSSIVIIVIFQSPLSFGSPFHIHTIIRSLYMQSRSSNNLHYFFSKTFVLTFFSFSYLFFVPRLSSKLQMVAGSYIQDFALVFH